MPQVSTVSELNKQKLRLFVDAVLNAGQLELIDELIAADYLGHLHCCTPVVVIGRDGVRLLVSSNRRTHPDVQFTIADLIAEDDRVAVRWRTSAPPPGIQSTKDQCALCWQGLTIIRFLAGRQVDSHTECANSPKRKRGS